MSIEIRTKCDIVTFRFYSAETSRAILSWLVKSRSWLSLSLVRDRILSVSTIQCLPQTSISPLSMVEPSRPSSGPRCGTTCRRPKATPTSSSICRSRRRLPHFSNLTRSWIVQRCSQSARLNGRSSLHLLGSWCSQIRRRVRWTLRSKVPYNRNWSKRRWLPKTVRNWIASQLKSIARRKID